MNVAIWLVAGGVLGWLSHAFLGALERWGAIVPIAIGAVGGFAGGNVLAPMLGAVRETPNDFSFFSVIIALLCAAALLVAGNIALKRSKDDPA